MKRKESIVRRMIEMYQQWQMVKMLKINQHDWGVSKTETTPEGTEEERYTRVIKELVDVTRRRTDPVVLVAELSFEYLKKYGGKECKNNNIFDWGNPTKKVSQAKSLLISCEKQGYFEYINVDREGDHLVITEDGKKFGTIFGLFKRIGRELGEAIKDWQVAFYAILALISALKLGWIKTFTSQFTNWW